MKYLADVICFAWNKLLNLFEENQKEKLKSQTSDKKSNKISSSAFTLNLEDEKELIEYFLLNSIELVDNNCSIITTNQLPARKLAKVSEMYEMKKSLQVK